MPPGHRSPGRIFLKYWKIKKKYHPVTGLHWKAKRLSHITNQILMLWPHFTIYTTNNWDPAAMIPPHNCDTNLPWRGEHIAPMAQFSPPTLATNFYPTCDWMMVMMMRMGIDRNSSTHLSSHCHRPGRSRQRQPEARQTDGKEHFSFLSSLIFIDFFIDNGHNKLKVLERRESQKTCGI